MYQMIPLYVFKTKIYHFSTIFLQFELICELKRIDNESDMRDPPDSAEVAETLVILLRWTWPHLQPI
jgi:hypothetical protein